MEAHVVKTILVPLLSYTMAWQFVPLEKKLKRSKDFRARPIMTA